MKAIDFACRLIVNITEQRQSLPSVCVLFAVAAGLECREDISQVTRLTNSSCTFLLRQLEKQGLVFSLVREDGDVYLLSHKGKDYVRTLLSFLPHPTE